MNPNNTPESEQKPPETPNQAAPQDAAGPTMQPSDPPVTPPDPAPVVTVSPGAGSKKPLVIILVVLLLLVAAGAVYWFMLRDKGTAKTNTTNTTNTQDTTEATAETGDALAALKADSDAAGLTSTSAADAKNPAIYRYYDKEGTSIAILPALTIVVGGYMDATYAADLAKVEQLMTDNDLSLVHGSMAASAWQGTGGNAAYVTYEGDTVSCSGRVGQTAGHLYCHLNTKLASVYEDVEAAWATFPSTLVKPKLALDMSTYYESTDGTVKAVGVSSNAEHTDGTYYDEFAVKVGSADWKYISSEAPLSTSGQDPSRPCSMLTKAEYKDTFRSITDSSVGCVAGS